MVDFPEDQLTSRLQGGIRGHWLGGQDEDKGLSSLALAALIP